MIGFKSNRKFNRYKSNYDRKNKGKNNFNEKRNYKNDIEKKNYINEIEEYLTNILYIFNEKYEKYFVYILKEEKLEKRNEIFNMLNLNFVYNLDEDIIIIEKIKEEIKDYELQLLTKRKNSKILEKVIFYCFLLMKYNEKNVQNENINIQCIKIYSHFLKVLESNLIELSTCTYASHFVETMISIFPFIIKYEEKYKDIKNIEMLKSFHNISDIIIQNIFSLIFHKIGKHVLKSFIYVITGNFNFIISFKKSRLKKKDPNVIKYFEKDYMNENLVCYINKTIEILSNEIENPSISLKHKNLLFQYIYYDVEKEDINEENKINYLIKQSKFQNFICPLLYNEESTVVLSLFFELLNKKNIKYDDLLCKIFLIEKTKKYFVNKVIDDKKCYNESPLKQILDMLIKKKDSSIVIEKLLLSNNENVFYVFNSYILKYINNLICDNDYSYSILCHYMNFNSITEEMFDLLIKHINIEEIIKKKKFNFLNYLFNLSKYYKSHCKYLFNNLIKNLNLNNKENYKPMWICILCMCTVDELNEIIKDMFNKSDKHILENNENDEIKKNENNINNNNKISLNNYNFYKYIKFDVSGINILLHLLSFPKDSITPLINSFKYFCSFLKHINKNEPSSADIENFNEMLMQNKSNRKNSSNKYNCNKIEINYNNNENNYNVENNENYENNKCNYNNTDEENNFINDNNEIEIYNIDNISNIYDKTDDTNSNNPNNIINKEKKNNHRMNQDFYKNILLYFSCDNLLSRCCEKIVEPYSCIKEKYIRKFIFLFKEVYTKMAVNSKGCYVIISFFKAGKDDIKKLIMNELIQKDLNMYQQYLVNFLKLKEYIKSRTINTNNKKYVKAKKLFESILIPEENKLEETINEKSIENDVTKSFDSIKENEIVYTNNESFENVEKNDINKINNLSNKKKKKKSHKNNLIENTHINSSFDNESLEIKEKTENKNNNDFMNVLSLYIKNTKSKSRKRKKEKEEIDKIIKKKK